MFLWITGIQFGRKNVSNSDSIWNTTALYTANWRQPYFLESKAVRTFAIWNVQSPSCNSAIFYSHSGTQCMGIYHDNTYVSDTTYMSDATYMSGNVTNPTDLTCSTCNLQIVPSGLNHGCQPFRLLAAGGSRRNWKTPVFSPAFFICATTEQF